MNENRFGKNLKHLRKYYDETQMQLADIIDVACGTVSHLESERSEPNLEQLKKIADHYGITTDALLYSDFEELSKKQWNFTKDKILLMIKVMYPMVSSIEAERDTLFVKGYNYWQEVLRGLAENRISDAWEMAIECFCDSYEKNETIESACNLLGIIFCEWGEIANKHLSETLLTANEGLYSLIVKQVIQKKIPIQNEESLKIREEFRQDLFDAIDELMKKIYKSSRWYQISEYYSALSYLNGMINNGASPAINEHVGSEMMASLESLGNHYAKDYFKLVSELHSSK